MKTLLKHSLLYLSVAALLFTFSCGEDEEEPTAAAPSISVSFKVEGATATTAYADDSISFVITASAEGQINRIVGSVSNGAASSELFDETRTSLELTDPTSAEFGGYIKPEANDVGDTWTFTFVVVDDLNQTDTASFSVDIIADPSPEARSYSAILLSVPTGDFTNENFFSTSDGMIYSSDEVTSTAAAVSPTIDFGYYYGSTDLASIASPAGFATTVFSAQVDGWNTKNATSIRSTTLTSAQFLEVTTFADIDEVYEAGTDEAGIITGLEEGAVVAFETVAGKRGLILVTEIEPGFDSNDFIKIDVLVQESAN